MERRMEPRMMNMHPMAMVRRRLNLSPSLKQERVPNMHQLSRVQQQYFES